MRRTLWRLGAVILIMAGASALSASPAMCVGAGCGQCGWECPGLLECHDDVGAHWTDVCLCHSGGCVTATDYDCPPN